MKKLTMILLALLVVAAGIFFTVSAEGDGKAYISPTAPTHTGVTVTQTPPTVPGVISTLPPYSSVTVPGTPGTTGVRPTTTPVSGRPSPSLTLPSSATTPDGSTVTGTAKPDQNPSSPKTGDTSAEVFAFAAFAFVCTGTAIALKKRKASDAK